MEFCSNMSIHGVFGEEMVVALHVEIRDMSREAGMPHCRYPL